MVSVLGVSRFTVTGPAARTGVAAGGTTPDLSLNVEEVGCVGACAIGPLVILDGEYHGGMTSGQLTKVVEKLQKEEGGK